MRCAKCSTTTRCARRRCERGAGQKAPRSATGAPPPPPRRRGWRSLERVGLALGARPVGLARGRLLAVAERDHAEDGVAEHADELGSLLQIEEPVETTEPEGTMEPGEPAEPEETPEVEQTAIPEGEIGLEATSEVGETEATAEVSETEESGEVAPEEVETTTPEAGGTNGTGASGETGASEDSTPAAGTEAEALPQTGLNTAVLVGLALGLMALMLIARRLRAI